VELIALAGGAAHSGLAALTAETETGAGLQINLFWVIVAALNFVLLLTLLWQFGFGPVSRMLAERRERIEQGLRDAEQARQFSWMGRQHQRSARLAEHLFVTGEGVDAVGVEDGRPISKARSSAPSPTSVRKWQTSLSRRRARSSASR